MADHDDCEMGDDEFEERNGETIDEESHCNDSEKRNVESGDEESDYTGDEEFNYASDELDPPKQNENEKKGVRGRTRLKNVIENRSKGIREKIQYDEKGQEVEEENISFHSFLGITAREVVPINVSDWRKVSKKIKARLWHVVNVRSDFFIFIFFKSKCVCS